ncbi:protein UL148D [Panine betaherpesvirus 2]|uniref:Protein UL148D n=1 Tax=Panine betaherpesvirus 2 TaxID=188763 RepID=Q8QRW2_9BETA|nr:protein UL148D [Panine betaherpesvirus 2]AAM00776.1 protein UL148D [Panine betaherpesvirus 2]QXV67890.1 protein UL148D [Panine betaherpesvirus 2]
MTAPTAGTGYLVKTQERKEWWPDNSLKRWWIGILVIIIIGVSLVAFMMFMQKHGASGSTSSG